jgi:formylglycine-generating enzyme required for sulfatase activity
MAHRTVLIVSLVVLLASSLACCCLPPFTPGLPTQTPTALGLPAQTPIPQPTMRSTPSVIDTSTRPADGMVMVYVPAGEFQMGSADGASEEQPVHTVALDGFWIDQTEVTNAQYARCVAAGVCEPPTNNGSNTRSYYDNPAYADYPVIWVPWEHAAAYAEWVGGRLPTEAEWEYAARGPEGSVYPWGTQAPDCTLANFGVCEGDTTLVGSHPAGASWVGALDMAGNVWEWTADWHTPYSAGRQENPTGPTTGENRVVRGGAWDSNAEHVRAAHRWGYPYYCDNSLGFRVVVVSPVSP